MVFGHVRKVRLKVSEPNVLCPSGNAVARNQRSVWVYLLPDARRAPREEDLVFCLAGSQP